MWCRPRHPTIITITGQPITKTTITGLRSTDQNMACRGHRVGMAHTPTQISNHHHPRLLRRLQKQVAPPVRSKKSRLSSKRLKQKQNGPESQRSPKRTLREVAPHASNKS